MNPNHPFTPYEKMAESPDRWRLEPSAYRLFRKTRWVVTEKIHGANFSFLTDGKTLSCANRRHVLEEDESFFCWQSVRDLHADAVQKLFGKVQAKHPETVKIHLYGELFGGSYPHPDVPALPGVQPIQTGVWYSPDIRFCAFDLRVETGDGEPRYLDYEEVMRHLEGVGLPYAMPLFTGTYEQALEYQTRFDSTLPRRLGLPLLPAGTNLAEGVVIKPLRGIVLPTPTGPVRPILKRKITEFAEDRRFHEAEKWEETRQEPAHGGTLDLAKWEAYNRLTENRLQAARSKVGDAPEKRRDVIAVFVADVEEDVAAANPVLIAGLTAVQRSALREYIREEAGRLAPSDTSP